MKKVLISGAGVSGLATALLLDKKKYEVTLVEHADKFLSAGYAIILWRPGYDILSGLIDTNAITSPIKEFNFYGGRHLDKLHSIDTGGIGYTTNREDLISSLSKKFIEQIGADKVRFNYEINSISESNGGNLVRFSNVESEVFDLVIVAEGVHSKIRDEHFDVTTKKYDFPIKYQWVEHNNKIASKAFFGFMKGHMMLVYSTKDHIVAGHYGYSDKISDNEFEDEIVKMIKRETGAVIKLDDKNAQSFTVETIDTKHAVSHRIALVGDALHARAPTIGFGTSAALEDAASIASRLNITSTDDIADSLSGYTEERGKRIKEIYGFQEFAEKILIGDDIARAELVPSAIKYGGKYGLEKWFKHIL